MKNILNFNIWTNKTFQVPERLLTYQLLTFHIESLFIYFKDLGYKPDQQIFLLVVIEYLYAMKTLGKVNKVRYNDLDRLINIYTQILRLKSDNYLNQPVHTITFRYK